MISNLELLVAVVTIAATCCALLWWFKPDAAPTTNEMPQDEPLTFLFEGDILHHATDRAASAYAMAPGAHFWGDLHETLGDRFPDFPDDPPSGEAGKKMLKSKLYDDRCEMQISWRGDLCWVTLLNHSKPERTLPQTSTMQELSLLRRINETAPNPIWEETANGTVMWHNQAYADLRQKARTATSDAALTFEANRTSNSNRVQIQIDADGTTDWFELTRVPSDDNQIVHAIRITPVVDAEESQRNFVQTLAKTFASLSIGLAIFDRNKQLALFNPALVDLTDLPAQFLSARPDMLSFFDQLREKRKMPEPKNYLNWRDEIADVIAAAADGRYEETWSLETGQTYSVKGRPHPDGATAFMIEDISAEMTLTRSYRAELQQAQILLDAVSDAIAIFSPAGVLTFSNAPFQNLWQIDPDGAFADITLQDCAAIWKKRAQSKTDVQAIGRFLSDIGAPDPEDIVLRLSDGRALTSQIMPIPTGAIMVRFTPTSQDNTKAKQPAESV